MAAAGRTRIERENPSLRMYPREPSTLGEHPRKRMLHLGLSRDDLAKQLVVSCCDHLQLEDRQSGSSSPFSPKYHTVPGGGAALRLVDSPGGDHHTTTVWQVFGAVAGHTSLPLVVWAVT